MYYIILWHDATLNEDICICMSFSRQAALETIKRLVIAHNGERAYKIHMGTTCFEKKRGTARWSTEVFTKQMRQDPILEEAEDWELPF